MDMDGMVALSQEFGELGAELRGNDGSEQALHRLVELAVKYVAGCSCASITVLRGTQGRTIASSDEVAASADKLQYDLGEGPCVQAAKDDTNYLIHDVSAETRWPRYAAALLERTTIRSALAFQLAAQDSAALNLFGAAPGAFDDDAIAMGSIFAAQVSSLVALHEAVDKQANLTNALESSRHIGTALGVLMAHHKITQDAAFEVLRSASQQLNRKLRDVAAEVVETGTTPQVPGTTGAATAVR